MQQGQKYQAEYDCDGVAACGVWSSLDAADLALLAQVAQERQQAAGEVAGAAGTSAAPEAAGTAAYEEEERLHKAAPTPVPLLLPKARLAAPFEVLASSVQRQRPWLATASPPASSTGAPGLSLPAIAAGAACLAGAELEALRLAARREVGGMGRREHDILITLEMWG